MSLFTPKKVTSGDIATTPCPAKLYHPLAVPIPQSKTSVRRCPSSDIPITQYPAKSYNTPNTLRMSVCEKVFGNAGSVRPCPPRPSPPHPLSPPPPLPLCPLPTRECRHVRSRAGGCIWRGVRSG